MHATEPVTVKSLLSGTADVRVAGLRIFGHSGWLRFDQHFQVRDWLEIGRVHQRAFRIRNPTVSRYHCIIRRKADGEYEIVDRDSTNGVLVSPQGYYSRFHEVESATLHLGMIIKLGEVLLAPVNTAGACPVLVSRYSELARAIVGLYGTPHAADRCTGLSRKTVTRMLEQLQHARHAS